MNMIHFALWLGISLVQFGALVGYHEFWLFTGSPLIEILQMHQLLTSIITFANFCGVGTTCNQISATKTSLLVYF